MAEFRTKIRTKIKTEFVKLHIDLFKEFEKADICARAHRRMIGYSSHYSGVKIVNLAKKKIGYNIDTAGNKTIFDELYKIYKELMDPKKDAKKS